MGNLWLRHAGRSSGSESHRDFPRATGVPGTVSLRPSLYSESKTLHEKIPGYTLKFAQLPRAEGREESRGAALGPGPGSLRW